MCRLLVGLQISTLVVVHSTNSTTDAAMLTEMYGFNRMASCAQFSIIMPPPLIGGGIK